MLLQLESRQQTGLKAKKYRNAHQGKIRWTASRPPPPTPNLPNIEPPLPNERGDHSNSRGLPLFPRVLRTYRCNGQRVGQPFLLSPYPRKNLRGEDSPPKFRGEVSETPCFTMFLEGQPWEAAGLGN